MWSRLLESLRGGHFSFDFFFYEVLDIYNIYRTIKSNKQIDHNRIMHAQGRTRNYDQKEGR